MIQLGTINEFIKGKLAKVFGSISAEMSMLISLVITLLTIPKPKTEGVIPFWVLEWILIISIFVVFSWLCLKFIVLEYKDLRIYYDKAQKCISNKINNRTPEKKIQNAVKEIEDNIPKVQEQKIPLKQTQNF